MRCWKQNGKTATASATTANKFLPFGKVEISVLKSTAFVKILNLRALTAHTAPLAIQVFFRYCSVTLALSLSLLHTRNSPTLRATNTAPRSYWRTTRTPTDWPWQRSSLKVESGSFSPETKSVRNARACSPVDGSKFVVVCAGVCCLW